MKRLLLLLLLATLASCHPDPPTVPASVKAAEARATADSLRAARKDSAARHLYRLAQIESDSATYYYKQSHAILPSPADSATLLRAITEYFTPSR
jgi:hypothetical protein